MSNYLKAAIPGLVASLVMFVVLTVGIHVTGFAPFNVPPSAAFLEVLGINAGPLPLLAHFGYGATWSIVLFAIAGSNVDLKRGLGLGVGLWSFMMVVYSPIIGWGFFGFGGASNLAASDALFLEAGPKYAVMTFVLHLVYGAIVGKLTPVVTGGTSSTDTPERNSQLELAS